MLACTASGLNPSPQIEQFLLLISAIDNSALQPGQFEPDNVRPEAPANSIWLLSRSNLEVGASPIAHRLHLPSELV